MKVLLCSPYKNAPNVNWGGISVWANNVISYAKERESIDHICLIPVSFDRYHRGSSKVGLFLRVWYGYIDISKSLRNARKAVKRMHPDVIHVCSSASLSILKDICLLLFAKRLKTRVVFHYHFGLIPELHKKKNLELALIKFVVKHANSTIVMTKDTFEVLDNVAPGKITLIPNPITPSFFPTISQLSPSIKRIPGRIVYIGHIVPNKGIKEIVESCKNLGNVDIRLVGEAPSMGFVELLRSLVDVDSSSVKLTFTGKVSQNEVIKELLSGEQFVFPSYYEGFPNAILEAMACGCPIVASNVGAIPEMLDIDGSPCGVCVPPRDSDALKEAIESLLLDSSIRNELASRARKRVETEYTIAKVWEKLAKVWDPGLNTPVMD